MTRLQAGTFAFQAVDAVFQLAKGADIRQQLVFSLYCSRLRQFGRQFFLLRFQFAQALLPLGEMFL
jgi:hypothetical protein